MWSGIDVGDSAMEIKFGHGPILLGTEEDLKGNKGDNQKDRIERLAEVEHAEEKKDGKTKRH